MSKFSLRHRAHSFKNAAKGIALLFSQANAYIHSGVAGLVIIAGFVFNIALWEWCLLIMCIGSVFCAEAFNTAIEHLSDKVCRHYDPLIGKTKDIAAGAVLITVIAAVAVGLIIFIPKVLCG